MTAAPRPARCATRARQRRRRRPARKRWRSARSGSCADRRPVRALPAPPPSAPSA